jgi:hypothetical protein
MAVEVILAWPSHAATGVETMQRQDYHKPTSGEALVVLFVAISMVYRQNLPDCMNI